MTEWKAAGHAGRDQEQALWERFSASRRAAFDRRRSMAAERDRARGGARAAKRALIEQAQALVEPFDAAAAEPALARQMDEWKAAGSAGRADDEELWQAFRAARDQVLAQLRAARPPRRREGGAPAGTPRSRRARAGRRAQPQQPPQPPVSPLTVALRKHEERVAEVEQRLAEAKSGGSLARRRGACARAQARRRAGRARTRPRTARLRRLSAPSPRCRRRACRRGRARPPSPSSRQKCRRRAEGECTCSAQRQARAPSARWRCSVPPAPARSGCSSRPGISAARPVATCTQVSSTRCSDTPCSSRSEPRNSGPTTTRRSG